MGKRFTFGQVIILYFFRSRLVYRKETIDFYLLNCYTMLNDRK